MNSLRLTEKQQEVLWLRYGRRASIDQIARWLNITRRAVLSRLRNARGRTEKAGVDFPQLVMPEPPYPQSGAPRTRMLSESQLSSGKAAGLEMDDV